MKIIAISMVKNESDIIESFCRHTLTFCDEILIVDDFSNDNTREIILNLCNEGLNIYLFENPVTRGHYQAEITNKLLSLAINSHGADMVLPLDADEFLFPNVNCNLNVREVLESLPNDGTCTYAAAWISFIPTIFKGKNNVFLPEYFRKYCEYTGSTEKFDYVHIYSKVIIGSELIKKYNSLLIQGNHDAYKIQESHGTNIEKRIITELMLVHLPLRSVEQLITKAVIGWANALCMPDRESNSSHNPWHWQHICEELKLNGWLTETHVQDFVVNLYT